MLGQMTTNTADFMLSQFSPIHKGGLRVILRKYGGLALMFFASPVVVIVVLLRPWISFRLGTLDGIKIGAILVTPKLIFASNNKSYLSGARSTLWAALKSLT